MPESRTVDIQMLVAALDEVAEAVACLNVDPNGTSRLIFVNRAFERLTGSNSEKLLGKSLEIAGNLEANDAAHVSEALKTRQAFTGTPRRCRPDGRTYTTHCHLREVARSGSTWMWIERQVNPDSNQQDISTRTPEGEVASNVTEDSHAVEWLRIQRDLGLALSSTDNLTQALDSVLEANFHLAGIDCGGVYLVDRATGELNLVTHQNLDFEFIQAVRSLDSDTLQARLVNTGQPLYWNFAELQADWPQLIQAGLRSVIVLPVSYAGNVVASLNLASHSHNELSTSTRRAVEANAARMGDVITRIRATADLRESRDLLQAIISGTQDVICMQDLDGCYRLMNPAGLELFKQSIHEIVGLAEDRILSAEDARRMRTERQQVVQNGTPSSLEMTISRSGDTKNFLITTVPYRTADRQVAGTISVWRDMTTFRHTQERLQRSERLASIGTLAAGIAHEINNPVGGILLSAQGALDELADPRDSDFVRKCLQEITDDARRCGQIIRSVMRFARQEPTEKWPHDINALVKRAAHLTYETVEHRGGQMKLSLGENLPVVAVNPTEFEQVLVNLIHNALDAGGERIKINLRTEAGKGCVRVSVSDNGPGMSTQEMEHVFDPFYTTRQETGGTGLGLSVVHGIVQAHGGTISIESTLERGTRFVVEFPVLQTLRGA
ncbi:MAG: ATP-binding protein [Planctomycetota bacterium]